MKVSCNKMSLHGWQLGCVIEFHWTSIHIFFFFLGRIYATRTLYESEKKTRIQSGFMKFSYRRDTEMNFEGKRFKYL